MKNILVTSSLVLLILSCSSNDSNDDLLLQETNFYALDVGNSWVYKYYELDITDGSYSFNNVIDSVNIVGVETINNQLYYKFKTVTSGNTPNSENPGFEDGERYDFFRDSLGYLINDSGTKLFSSQNTDEWEYFQFPITYKFKLSENIENISTNAGLFECNTVQVKHIVDGIEAAGVNHRYYADGIGEVMLTLGFVNTSENEWLKKLDSYYIQ